MNKSIVILLAAALSSTVNAREIKIDFGRFSAPNCINDDRMLGESPTGNQNQARNYLERSIRVTGKVLLEIFNERDAYIVERCAEEAKEEIGDSFSPSNLAQFEMLFEKYIRRCSLIQNPNIRIIRAFIDQKDSCKDKY